MTLLEKYEKIKKEVEAFDLEIQSDPELSAQIEKYYKGVQVLFSPITENPKIMFIGINPGAGFFNSNKENTKVKRYSPLDKFEYIGGGYRLAQQTRELFERAGLTKKVLANSVKSNCFFLATKSEKELYQFLSHLKSTNVYAKSAKWIDELVLMIHPEIIICEGKSAFKHFIKGKNCIVKLDQDVYYANWNNMDIIGYKRNFSNIVKMKSVAEKLNECINKNNFQSKIET